MAKGDVLSGRFELERLAGAGGMGEVYRAHDRETGATVAVKLLIGGDEGDIARFEREARLLADLSHPAIVRHVAHGFSDAGEPYLVMEWLEGEDLRSRLSRGRLGVAESLDVAQQVAEALAAAHARGIVHRDLKPSNVFLVGGSLEDVRLLDFGIAFRSVATRMTQTGAVLGTPGYMAPEQARSGAGVTARADIFSLGCLLHECLLGEPAFKGEQVMAVLAKILFEDPPRLRELRPEVPEALDDLLARMLAKDPALRPRDGQEAADALAGFERDASFEAGVESARQGHEQASLTRAERRPMAVILIDAPPRGDDGAVSTHAATQPFFPDDELRREALRWGGQFEPMLDGGAAVTLVGTAAATDLAAQAARAALSLKRRSPERAMVLAMGRSAPSRRITMSEAIDQAARLMRSHAQKGEDAASTIVIDEVTAGLLDAQFDVRDEDLAFSLLGEREITAGARTLLGKPTSCVGRERELRALQDLFAECVDEGVAQAALVTAAPGMGKTRLGAELSRWVRQREEKPSIWIARGDPLRAGSMLGMLAQLLQSAAGIQDGEPAEQRREKLLARVAQRIAQPERQRVAEFLGEIVGAPFPDERSLKLLAARRDGQLMNEQMQKAFNDLVAAECDAQPVLIVLEDLHWGDAPTVRFLDTALRDLADRPLFVLALARPEVHKLFPGLWAGRSFHEIHLKGLGKKACERLVMQALGDAVGRETIERIVARADGNAFYLEELIRAAAEGRGAELPETVVAMVQSRLGALEAGTRRLLRAASIFGETFWIGGLSALMGGPSASRVRDLSLELIDKELFIKRRESRFPGEVELSFRHALLREGAYAMLTEEDRALGHRLAGEWLLSHGETDALVLAEHFMRGGAPAQAARHWLSAAQRANRGGDAAATFAYAQRGLACDVDRELRIPLLGLACEARSYDLAGIAEALPAAEELWQTAPPGSLPWAQAACAKASGALVMGQLDALYALLRVVLETEPTPEAAGTMLLSLIIGVFALDMMGMVREADAMVERVSTIARAAGEGEPRLLIMWYGTLAARSAYARENPWEAVVHSEKGHTLGGAMGDRRLEGINGVHLGMNLAYLGALREAEQYLCDPRASDEEFGYAFSFRRFTLAWLLADRGALDEARAQAHSLVEAARARKLPLDEGRGRWVLAEALRRAGDLKDAEREIHEALSLLGKASRLDPPGALATLAALLRDQGRVEEALATAERAMADYESIGACMFFRGAFLRLVHAECLMAAGRLDDARAALGAARAGLLSIAEKIADPERRRSFLSAVPENRRTLELASTSH